MDTDKLARIIAVIGTLLVAALTMVLLTLSHLAVSAHDTVAPPKGEIMLAEEEFVDLLEPTTTSTAGQEDAASYLDEPEHNPSQAAPASGTDVADAGPQGEPAPVVAAKEPSPVKVTNDKKADEGAKVDKQKQEEERVRREASNEVANAFRNASGKNNSATSPDADKGRSGDKTQNTASQGITGYGTGSVGGGWIIPKYAHVRSTVTGSVKMIVKIDNTGKVISVTFNGGEPPAATDKAVQAAIEKELRSRKFSRSSYDDAEGATAYITYTFK